IAILSIVIASMDNTQQLPTTDPALQVAVLYNPPVEQTDPEMFGTEDGIDELAEEIAEALRKFGYEATTQPVSEKNLYRLKLKKYDAIFNLCDGDKLYMRVARQLEKHRKMFTGSGSKVFALTVDKVATKKIFDEIGVPTPAWQFFKTGTEKLRSDLKFPLIVKPYKEDCSVGITTDSIVNDDEHLRARVAWIREKYKQGSLIEEFIPGREINCTVIGNGEDCEVFPLSEIGLQKKETPDSFIYDYNTKWTLADEEQLPACHCPAPSISAETAKKIQSDAKKAFIALQMKDYARFDIRYNEHTGKWYFIEANANPSIQNTDDEPTSVSAATRGLEYEAFVREILESCRQRYQAKLD
ncbi:MAG TPA: ATP-grasp domain-containing protein, partial [Candidatus Saccharimonadia bacterium]|nr:ATP-grasp domain-containing protein [Candidatus Saccharimonadia bacterium]